MNSPSTFFFSTYGTWPRVAMACVSFSTAGSGNKAMTRPPDSGPRAITKTAALRTLGLTGMEFKALPIDPRCARAHGSTTG